ELGSGSGVVSLAIARRVEGVRVTGIEIDPALCHLAARNAERNGLGQYANFICGDVTGPVSELLAAGLAPDSFDHAVANPPFLSEDQARLPANARLRRAHALGKGDLALWIKCLGTFVRPGGTMTVVHRADALPQLFDACKGRFGGLTVLPLHPRPNTAANRIILHGRKGSRTPLKLHPGIVLHNDGRGFTETADAILREGEGLKFPLAGSI
ncbi:MAG TPA: methyltransferase domain-containing protein, partial [Hyphomicrobiales bacterium]|nr:methyltransferase domain-containing protein [Hyphomicrobiales bacterium]